MFADNPACSFCGASQQQSLRKMVAGPVARICEVCVQALGRPGVPEAAAALTRCSFCGRSRPAVPRLAGGPRGAAICVECLRLADDVGPCS